MKNEFVRQMKDPLYWAVLAGGLSVRVVLAWFDRSVRMEAFWDIAGNFWSIIGSVTAAFLVLLVLIHLFSVDRETGTAPVIASTVHGRSHLLRDRLMAGCAASILGTALLAIGNGAVSLLLGRELPAPDGWAGTYLRSSAIAALGAAGYFLLAACVCDIVKNQPAAMGICGCPLILSYMLGYNAAFLVTPVDLTQPDAWWLLRYGWFLPLLRGRMLGAIPWFFPAWYLVLLGGVLLMAVHIRKGRKEL